MEEKKKYNDFYFVHCLNAQQLFINFPLRKLRYKHKELMENPDVSGNRRELCAKVFRESARVILNDIVENDVQFLLPGELFKSYIKMKVFTKDDFLRVRKDYGKFSNIDPDMSNFRGYQLYLYIGKGQTTIEKPIYATHALRDKIVEYTNNGKRYTE